MSIVILNAASIRRKPCTHIRKQLRIHNRTYTIQGYIDAYNAYTDNINNLIHSHSKIGMYNTLFDEHIVNTQSSSTDFVNAAILRCKCPIICIGSQTYDYGIKSKRINKCAIQKNALLSEFTNTHSKVHELYADASRKQNMLKGWLVDFRYSLRTVNEIYKFSYMQSWKAIKKVNMSHLNILKCYK